MKFTHVFELRADKIDKIAHCSSMLFSCQTSYVRFLHSLQTVVVLSTLYEVLEGAWSFVYHFLIVLEFGNVG